MSTRNHTSRAAALGLLLMVLVLAVPAFSAGYEVLAKGPGHATVDSTGVLAGQSSRPAIRLPVEQGLSQSPGLPSQNTSSNWSGYVVSSDVGSVTNVNGSWIVPSVSCSRTGSYSAFWVGIDGWSDSTVEQIGTDSDCLGGTPTYYAWYEYYPADEVPIDNVAAWVGDTISASVSCQADGLECTVSIADISTGQSFSQSQTFMSGRGPQMSSADWIAEAPSLTSGKTLPLAYFGAVHFGQNSTGVVSSDYATVNGTSGPIGSFGSAVVEITMVTRDGSTLAQPLGLSQNDSFSVARSGSSFPVVSCSPAPVAVGSATTCTATVRGSSPVPTGVITWSGNGNGKFSKLTCSLSNGACSVKFTPTAVISIVTLTAKYGGDSENSPSTGTYGLTVRVTATSTTVSCTPKSAVAGSSAIIKCKAKVTGYSPTGEVSWSQSGNGSVSLGSTSCFLLQGGCSVTVSGSAAGQVIMNATYSGDSNNQGSSRTAPVTVRKASTTVATSCAQSSVAVGTNVTCTATVSGGSLSHNGTITWSKASGKGSVAFSSATCALSSGSCSMTVNATVAGGVKIETAYGGDSNNQGSSRTAALTVTKAPTILTLSCTETAFSAGTPVTCTAAVSGEYLSQTGTVTWSRVSGRVTFSSTTCALSSGSCSVTVTATAAGNVKIRAAYGGDSDNLKSSGTLVLTITKS